MNNGNGIAVLNGNGNGTYNGIGHYSNDYHPPILPDHAKQSVILPPSNMEAEEAVIGSLIIDGDEFYKIADLLNKQDFYLVKHGLIFQAMADLYHSKVPIDLITLTDKLEANGDLEDIGGIGVLTDFINYTPTSIHLEYYALIVADLSVKRSLIKAGADITKLAYQANETGEILLGQSIDIVNKIETKSSRGGFSCANEAANILLDRLEEKFNGESTGLSIGIKGIDKLLGGLERGKVYLLAGRPGMGKSGMAISIMRKLCFDNKKVGFFSLEMPKEDIVGRMAAQLSGVSYSKINAMEASEKEIDNFYSAIFKIQNNPYIFIDDTPGRTMSSMRNNAKKKMIESGLDLIIVDHFGEAQSGQRKNNDYEEYSEIARQTLVMGKELNIPILGLLQLSRTVENRKPPRPIMADLRSTGRWEEIAHAIMFLYRDGYYNEDTQYPNVGEVIVAKNRGGSIGSVQTYWKATTTEYLDLAVKNQPLDY